MINVLALSAEGRGSHPVGRNQLKTKSDIFCFSTKHATLTSKRKLAGSKSMEFVVSEWCDIFFVYQRNVVSLI